MFGFGWVSTHLGYVFLKIIRFSFDFGWIFGKIEKISKSGQFRGPTSWRRDPTQQHKSTPRCGMSTPRHD